MESIGEATAHGRKQVLFAEAIQDALDKAPPPPPGYDIQHFRLVAVELEYGGIVGSTRTRVTLDVQPGELP